MPQLDKNAAKRTATAETSWEMEEGVYEVVLHAVEDVDPKTKQPYVGKDSGIPFWKWVVEFPKDANEGKYAKRKIWTVISLGESSDTIRKLAFAAFGDPTATKNTDELIGNRALVRVENGEYNGQLNPKVRAFMPLNDASQITGKGDVDNENLF